MAENKYNQTKFENYYTDWIPFIHFTQEKIEELEKVGAACYINPSNLVVFYSKMKLFVSVRKKYLKKITEDLIKIEEVGKYLFSAEFYKNTQNNKNFFGDKIYMENLNKLINLLSTVSVQLAEHKLLYDINEVSNDDLDIYKNATSSAEKSALKAFEHLIFQRQGRKK